MRVDWRFTLIILFVIGVNLVRDYYGQEPAPRRPVPESAPGIPDYGDTKGPLPGVSRLDPEVVVGLGQKMDSTGTAFALDSGGWWMTARHVVDQCHRVHLLFQNHQGLWVTNVVHHTNADLALLRTSSLPHALPIADGTLQIGQNGFHVGYPRGSPGEVWSTLLGRRRMRVSGRYRTNEPVVAWAERRRRPSSLKSLGGLSGGPALDGAGRVVGVLVAESRRRGRVYTAAPASIDQLVSRGVVNKVAGRVLAITPDTLKPRADLLRRAPGIAKVVCLVD